MSDALISRTEALDFVASTLMIRASKLSRILLSGGQTALSRTEMGLLGTLLSGPHRITELAATEALAQPTVTRVVDNLERLGLVARRHSAHDRRVVLVEISEPGRRALEAGRAWYRAQLREVLNTLDDEQVAHLAAASESLGQILELLQSPVAPR